METSIDEAFAEFYRIAMDSDYPLLDFEKDGRLSPEIRQDLDFVGFADGYSGAECRHELGLVYEGGYDDGKRFASGEVVDCLGAVRKIRK